MSDRSSDIRGFGYVNGNSHISMFFCDLTSIVDITCILSKSLKHYHAVPTIQAIKEPVTLPFNVTSFPPCLITQSLCPMTLVQPPTSISFTEQLCDLASITHGRDYAPTVSYNPVPNQEKHLRLLDSIALLLATEEKSDVIAGMLEQTPAQMIFCCCRDRPCTAREREYVDGLLRLAVTVTDVQDCSLQLLHRAIPICRGKILIRLKRLQYCIPVPLFVFDDVNGSFHHRLIAKMPHLFPNTGPTSLSRNTLLNYIAQLGITDVNNSADKGFGRLIRFACVIGSYQHLKDLIRDDTIVGRLGK